MPVMYGCACIQLLLFLIRYLLSVVAISQVEPES